MKLTTNLSFDCNDYNVEDIAALIEFIAEANAELAELSKNESEVIELMEDFDAEDFIDHESYDDLLDEIYPEFELGYCSYSPSEILKKVDPIAYNVGFSDYCSNIEKECIPEYQEMEEDLVSIQDAMCDLEEMIDDAALHLEDLQERLDV